MTVRPRRSSNTIAWPCRAGGLCDAPLVHVLPASGHWPYADAPETVERLLLGFRERVGATG